MSRRGDPGVVGLRAMFVRDRDETTASHTNIATFTAQSHAKTAVAIHPTVSNAPLSSDPFATAKLVAAATTLTAASATNDIIPERDAIGRPATT